MCSGDTDLGLGLHCPALEGPCLRLGHGCPPLRLGYGGGWGSDEKALCGGMELSLRPRFCGFNSCEVQGLLSHGLKTGLGFLQKEVLTVDGS